jgi:glutamate-5-semialdehyde dehydrogenase
VNKLACSILKTADIKAYMKSIDANASYASKILATASMTTKNDALTKIAFALEENRAHLLIANSQDMNNARTYGLDVTILDRLAFSKSRINAMIEILNQVAALPDPIGDVTDLQSRPSGIELGKMRVPLSIIGIIYESRLNVTINAASLCLKSGNVTILRGGSEAILSNQTLASCINQGLLSAGLPSTAVQVTQMTDRAAVGELP